MLKEWNMQFLVKDFILILILFKQMKYIINKYQLYRRHICISQSIKEKKEI